MVPFPLHSQTIQSLNTITTYILLHPGPPCIHIIMGLVGSGVPTVVPSADTNI